MVTKWGDRSFHNVYKASSCTPYIYKISICQLYPSKAGKQIKRRRRHRRPVRPTTTHSSNILLLRFQVLCITFVSLRDFKYLWFLIAYLQYILSIPLGDIFSYIWRLKGKRQREREKKQVLGKWLNRKWSNYMLSTRNKF